MSTPELTRRVALGGLLAGVTLAGCDLTATGPAPTGRTSAAPREAAPEPPADPDTDLVDEVRGDLTTALTLVTAALRSRPGLAPELGGFRQLHRRHLDALPGESEDPPRTRVRGDAGRVRDQVRALETRLQGSLADAAVRAESGPLAALLASMSAAVAQRLALPTRGTG